MGGAGENGKSLKARGVAGKAFCEKMGQEGHLDRAEGGEKEGKMVSGKERMNFEKGREQALGMVEE